MRTRSDAHPLQPASIFFAGSLMLLMLAGFLKYDISYWVWLLADPMDVDSLGRMNVLNVYLVAEKYSEYT